MSDRNWSDQDSDGSSSGSSNSSEDEQFDDLKDLCENFTKLKPYDFEPLASTEESDEEEIDDKTDEKEEESVQRRGKKDWCLCESCEPMSTEVESLCCQEANEIPDNKFEGTFIYFNF